jgi:hypothetical protein
MKQRSDDREQATCSEYGTACGRKTFVSGWARYLV